MTEIRLGMIASYEPSDRYEWGVVYSVDDDHRGGWAAFLDGCSWRGFLALRHVTVDGDVIQVRHYRDAKLREAHMVEYDYTEHFTDASEEQSLAEALKVSAMYPKGMEIRCFCPPEGKFTQWRELKEQSRFRKAIYNMLASDDCAWLRHLWKDLPNSFNEYYNDDDDKENINTY